MPFKLNLSEKSGKTYKLELDSESLVGKSLGDKVDGTDINSDLNGYEFEITGASDKAGFPSLASVEGVGLKKQLMTYGVGMKKHPKKEGKRKRSKNRPKGLRLRKTIRGKVISTAVTQINLKVIKEGGKKLPEIFADQNQLKAPKENRALKRKTANGKSKQVQEEKASEEQ
jgi:small subunit ribosomal protein S6e